MEIHLERIEDQAGSSRGAWGVKEYPGLSLFRAKQGWRIRLGALSGPDDQRVFLKPGRMSEETLRLYREHQALRRTYTTRRELKTAIEIAMELSRREPVKS